MQFAAIQRHKIKERGRVLYYKYSQGSVMQSLGMIDRCKLHLNFDKWYYLIIALHRGICKTPKTAGF